MRSLHVPMTWEKWERPPWRFGWKHEYWDRHAHLTPHAAHVHVYARIQPRAAAAAPTSLRPVAPADAPASIEAFIVAFEDGDEFCDWPARKIHEHARQNITGYFAGRRGRPLLETSRLDLGDEGAVLDLLMVRPGFRRRRIAGQLVGIETLHARGATGVLRSAYQVANEESGNWHRVFGFEEEPDLHLARMRRLLRYSW